jgi:gamma-glutamylcysteine synthetase
MYRLAEQRLKNLSVACDEKLLQGGRKGLEKESLRISRVGLAADTSVHYDRLFRSAH